MKKAIANRDEEAGFISSKLLNILLSLALVIAITYIIIEKQGTEEKIQAEVAEALAAYKASEEENNSESVQDKEESKDEKIRYNFTNNSKMDHHIANARQLIESAKLFEAINDQEIDGNGLSYTALLEAEVIDVMDDPWTKEAYQNKDQIKVFKEEHEGELQYRVELSAEDTRYFINRYEIELVNNTRQEIFE